MAFRADSGRAPRICGAIVAASVSLTVLVCPAVAPAAPLTAAAPRAAAPPRAAAATPTAASRSPTISPAQGTPDASPDTQISILGVAPGLIAGVRVDGSASGPHRGRLRRYSGGRGASFILGAPLAQGEHVRVQVRLRGRRAVRTSFTVAHLGVIPPVLGITTFQQGKLDHFSSLPSLLPPRITVRRGSSTGGGDIFLTPLPAPEIHPESNNELTIKPVGPGGPMIVDGHGRLIWFDQLTPPLVAANFRPQRLDGHEVLTWWQGGVTLAAFGLGEGVIADGSYRTLRTVKAGNGYQVDIHEFLITPAGDALFTVYSPVLVHLPGTAPGTRSPLLDSIVQEVDIRTGLVVWEWHSFGHIPLADSYVTPSASATFDAYHLNSIQVLRGGRLLVSARDTSAVYEIDRASDRIVWTLGGKASSFRLGRGARFFFQHDALMLPHARLSLFDDGAGPPSFERASRGLVLALDRRRHKATVVAQYHRPGRPTLAESEGNVQTLAGGNEFVGFGATPYFSEFSAAGRLLFDAALPADDGSYREFRFPWQATPAAPPVAVARRTSASRVVISVSWNGATAVARWQLLAGASTRSLRPVLSVAARGFETRLTVTSRAGSFALRALGAHGRVLGQSAPVRPS